MVIDSCSSSLSDNPLESYSLARQEDTRLAKACLEDRASFLQTKQLQASVYKRLKQYQDTEINQTQFRLLQGIISNNFGY